MIAGTIKIELHIAYDADNLRLREIFEDELKHGLLKECVRRKYKKMGVTVRHAEVFDGGKS